MSALKSNTRSRAARTPAQQAIIDEMRKGMSAEDATAKHTEHATAQAVDFVMVADSAPMASEEDIEAQATAYFAELIANMALTKRRVLAFMLSMIAAGGTGYVIGTLAGYAIAGIAVLSGSMFWAFLISVLALLASYYAGAAVCRVVSSYVLDARIDEDYATAKAAVSGWYDSVKSLVSKDETAQAVA